MSQNLVIAYQRDVALIEQAGQTSATAEFTTATIWLPKETDMTRSPLLILSLLALTACSTPREQCIGASNRPVAQLDRLINVTRGNISRGFALAQVQDVRVLRASCEGTNADGSTFRFPCEETETITRQEPVTINIAEERIKLAQLESRREQSARAAQDRIQQCIAVHPE
jgi:hypothetical protein